MKPLAPSSPPALACESLDSTKISGSEVFRYSWRDRLGTDGIFYLSAAALQRHHRPSIPRPAASYCHCYPLTRQTSKTPPTSSTGSERSNINRTKPALCRCSIPGSPSHATSRLRHSHKYTDAIHGQREHARDRGIDHGKLFWHASSLPELARAYGPHRLARWVPV